MSDAVKALFAAHAPDYLKFSDLTGDLRLSNRADLCAMLLLDRVLPDGARHLDIIQGAEHDIIYFVDVDVFATVATDALIQALVRCGVHVDSASDCLAKFA